MKGMQPGIPVIENSFPAKDVGKPFSYFILRILLLYQWYRRYRWYG